MFLRYLSCALVLVTGSALAQDILPFPPAPSGSQAGVTIQSSRYKKRVEPRRLPENVPQHPDHPDG